VAPPALDTDCVDCEKVRATRLCDQCGDKYCASCYDKAHPKGGKRESHTYMHIGPIECEECTTSTAVRWCTQCDGPFCMDCWTSIHTNGSRAYHGYCNIDSEGSVSPRAWTADGSAAGVFPYGNIDPNNEGEMDDTEGLPAGDFNQTQANIAPGLGTDDTTYERRWSTHHDENNVTYYYDEVTGESTYENPFENPVGITSIQQYEQQSWEVGTYESTNNVQIDEAGFSGLVGNNQWKADEQTLGYQNPNGSRVWGAGDAVNEYEYDPYKHYGEVMDNPQNYQHAEIPPNEKEIKEGKAFLRKNMMSSMIKKLNWR